MTRENLKYAAKSLLRAIGLRPSCVGINLYDEFRIRLPKLEMRTIFDVGANDGQTAIKLVGLYPNASIHSFEPNPDCCQTLKRAFGDKIAVHQSAVGSRNGEIGFDRSIGHSTLFSVNDNVTSEIVPITTIDQFCADNSIETIDFLKIDTEGHDLEVIKGASRILAEQKIGIVQAEVSMSARNSFQIQFPVIHAEIERHGYALFGIYEQIPDWQTNEPFVRNANTVYVSPVVMAQNKRA
jgi:FkbM family methyltransferase